MIRLDRTLTPTKLRHGIDRLWEASARKIDLLQRRWDPRQGSPVFTAAGRYASRGWTEWTQGFQFGSAILQFAATGDSEALAVGREGTLQHMATHVSHVGVHDHGFNNISTYGHLRQLALAGRFPADEGEIAAYEIALKVSGAVQAARWTALPEGLGYIYSFNGPHSLFADTIRTLRVLALAHWLGHVAKGEGDRVVPLLGRALAHARATARYNVFYGEGRDIYDVPGRTAHEAIFNVTDGSFRSVATQQGYSAFSTWTRGLSWAMCGFAELLEFVEALDPAELLPHGGKEAVVAVLERAAVATSDFYLAHTATDGVPYWDTGAPGLRDLPDPYGRPSDPENDVEPVDSSAAAIAAQGLLRLGAWRRATGRGGGDRYVHAGLTVLRTLLAEPYLSADPRHDGLLLHGQYHRPNGWDHVPAGRRSPSGEATMWGDYHLREVALYVGRLAGAGPYLAFFDKAGGGRPGRPGRGARPMTTEER